MAGDDQQGDERKRFFPAGEDAGLLDDDADDSPEPLIEFGRKPPRKPLPKPRKHGGKACRQKKRGR